MDPQKPFVLRGGNSSEAATFNRINVIERIAFLTGVDLRTKSVSYLKALDLELWQRWYKSESIKTVDETFCQRSAEVIRAMENLPQIEVDNVTHLAAYTEFQSKNKEKKDVDQHDQGSGENAGELSGEKGDSDRVTEPSES